MCPAAMLARAGLLLCLVVGSLQLSITEFQVPVALESGENAEFRCRYDRATESEDDLIVKWWWKPVNATTQPTQLYQRIGREHGAPMRHKFVIKDNDTIVLLNATPNDSGVYQCEVSSLSENITEERKQQELTIYTQGTGPNLTLSEIPDGPDADKEEDVLIECKVEDVAPAPDIVLSVNGKEFNMTEYITGPDAEGLYDIIGNATLSKGDVENTEVRCELFYTNQDVSHEPYFDAELYDPSGALTTTGAPEDATEPDATTDSLQNPSGECSQCHVSWALLLAFVLLTQAPALL